VFFGEEFKEIHADTDPAEMLVIRCKYIHNFLCSMVVLHQLLYVLFTLRGIFMHFRATVPVPIFCYFCISKKLYRKYSRHWTKQKLKFLFC
jgi:hypothetical protein